MISREKITDVKNILGKKAFEIMAEEIPLQEANIEKGTCKSPFKEERTASASWHKDKNYLHCFSTGLNMDFIDFSMKYKGMSFMGALRDLFIAAGETINEDDFIEESNQDYFKNFKYAQDEPESDCQNVALYLETRGISKNTVNYFGIKESKSGDIAFQFHDTYGKLIQTKYRVSKAAKNGEHKWYWQKDSGICPMLYGIDKIDISKPVTIVEGFCDALAVVESGYLNCVSIPGGANDKNWIDFNFDFLERCSEVILWFDDDTAGKGAVKECANRIGIYKTKIVESDEDVKRKISEYYLRFDAHTDKIDANNVLLACGKESVLKMISEAKAVENPLVQHLMDVEEIQLQDIPRVSTGFAAMDKIFYGNFVNSLTILTGRAGSGKSSILNTMFIAAPMEAGESVFIYSGEIPNGILLGNIIKPLASRRHIIEFKNEGKPNGYSVTRAAADDIKKFYRDKIFNYNDTNQFDTNSKSILQSMEYSYRRYGVTNFIIDSLLTVDCSKEDGDDKYDKQKNFVINLKNFTNRNPVRVALVAHSRKLAAGTSNIGGDDIAGSSDIVKCCNRAFSVDLLWDDPSGYNTKVTCIKDRETGMLNKEVKLYYDRKSYRIYSNQAELDKPYEWELFTKVVYNEEFRKNIVENIRENDVASEVLGTIK